MFFKANVLWKFVPVTCELLVLWFFYLFCFCFYCWRKLSFLLTLFLSGESVLCASNHLKIWRQFQWPLFSFAIAISENFNEARVLTANSEDSALNINCMMDKKLMKKRCSSSWRCVAIWFCCCAFWFCSRLICLFALNVCCVGVALPITF